LRHQKHIIKMTRQNLYPR